MLSPCARNRFFKSCLQKLTWPARTLAHPACLQRVGGSCVPGLNLSACASVCQLLLAHAKRNQAAGVQPPHSGGRTAQQGSCHWPVAIRQQPLQLRVCSWLAPHASGCPLHRPVARKLWRLACYRALTTGGTCCTALQPEPLGTSQQAAVRRAAQRVGHGSPCRSGRRR